MPRGGPVQLNGTGIILPPLRGGDFIGCIIPQVELWLLSSDPSGVFWTTGTPQGAGGG